EKVSVLYLSYGIKSVTMDDVAKHLGVSKKTLYAIVKDKDQLVRLVVDDQIEMHKQQDRVLKEKGISALEEMLIVFKRVSELLRSMNPSYQYDMNKYYPELSAKFISFKENQLFENIKENLIKGKKEGIYRPEINEDIIARMNSERNLSMFRNNENMQSWITHDSFQEIFLYHIHAVLSDKGRQLLKQTDLFNNN
ncbi:MAG: TetR/AcrR family transcriptional regulator, partial [Bacteroidales bacterium]|nr:TetR/AcrR family transcriptional regulator [Bacteroidales bacterium]